MVINRTMSFKRLACLELHSAGVVRALPPWRTDATRRAARFGAWLRPIGEFAASHLVTVDSLNKA
jgi:hypothetical protein